MSQHPSLKTSKASRRHRTVLKRFERFFALKEKGILKDSDSIFGMPKLKIIKVKVKKEKAEEKPEEVQAGAEAQTPTEAASQKQTEAKDKKEEKKEKK